ncbi:DUF3618 domain-containing protein [Pseudopontixanthobacter vadosimaris]|uniref:DUF3618 domain-containing protein n=1 Tax=Pseudopontixanthobacter vadosimaris TaxID=2726450 RepID=UPI00147417F1|nr:DUF3618 domain-containing protein [Pseudopontixanthobacter vadosimaris]
MTQTDTRDPDEIEMEIRRTQNDMSRTVDRIGDQMTPRNMLNSLLDKADENGVDARYLLDGARRNPLALGLVSAGAIWLVSDYDARPSAFTSDGSDDTGYDPQYDYDPDHRGYIDHMSRVERLPDDDEVTYQRRRDEARGTYLMIERGHDEDHTDYRKRLDEATDRMRQKRDSFADSARETRHNAALQGKKAVRKTRDAYQDNPLIGGLIAAVVGAVAGSAIPVSRTEREQLGPIGSDAIDQAEAKARQVGEQALDKKDELVEKADRKMSEQGSQSGSKS